MRVLELVLDGTWSLGTLSLVAAISMLVLLRHLFVNIDLILNIKV